MKSKIISLPDSRLRQKSETVFKVDKTILDIIKRMKKAAIEWEESRPHELSTALAAIQIGEPKRVVIVREEINNPKNKNFTVLINPEIIKKSGKKTKDLEGCLSVPDFYGQVPRYPKIKLKAKNEQGQTIFIKADGFLARILQHEVDHTNGIPFVDRIKEDHKAFYKLQEDGSLENIDYEEVRASGIFRD